MIPRAARPTYLSMMRLLHVSLLALVLAAAAVAAGCGGGQGGGNAALPVLTDLTPVANATGRADSARFEMRFEMSLPALGAPFAFSATGEYDTPANQARLTMDMSSFAEFLNGFASSFGGSSPELGDASLWKLDMLLDGDVAYMRAPFMTSELPRGKEWVSIDLTKAAQAGGFDLGELQSFAKGSDPRETLDYLRSVAGKLTHLGTEDVRGVETAHYFAIVDVQKALARVARATDEPGLLDQLRSFGGAIQNIPVDVWVDADNLVRRMTMELSFVGPGGEQDRFEGVIDLELFDYGTAVDVQPPPAADVVDALSLRS